MTQPDSHPDIILTALRRGRQSTSDLAALIGGTRDDVSRAVAHLREQGYITPSFRTCDALGAWGEAAYLLAYDKDSPADRRCVVPGCHEKLCRCNPGYTLTGKGPFCYYHRDMVEGLELDGIISELSAEQQRAYEQLYIAEVMAS